MVSVGGDMLGPGGDGFGIQTENAISSPQTVEDGMVFTSSNPSLSAPEPESSFASRRPLGKNQYWFTLW